MTNQYVKAIIKIRSKKNVQKRDKMKKSKKIKIFRIIMTILVLALCVGIIIYLIPVMKQLSSVEGQIAFKERVNESGILGLLILFGLQVAQIFLIIVPGEPIEILAGMCYGGIWGTIFIMTSCAIIATAIFLLVKKYGKKFVYEFCDPKKVRKIENSKTFQNPKKIEMIMLILFLIPGTPKDLLTYIAGLLPIKATRFIIISTFARIPSIISSTLAGASLAKGDWKTSLILYAIVLVIVAIIVFIINKFDKNKVTKEAIETIQ